MAPLMVVGHVCIGKFWEYLCPFPLIDSILLPDQGQRTTALTGRGFAVLQVRIISGA